MLQDRKGQKDQPFTQVPYVATNLMLAIMSVVVWIRSLGKAMAIVRLHPIPDPARTIRATLTERAACAGPEV